MIEESVFLHASSVITNSGAILFLGHSTSGKSTIARVLSTRYQVLADDTVFVSKTSNGSWYVQNGKTRSCSEFPINRSVDSKPESEERIDLFGFYRIFKDETISTCSIKPILLARYLMDAVMEVDIQRQPKFATLDSQSVALVEVFRRKRTNWFKTVSNIARVFPGWELHFPKNSSCLEIANIIERR